RAEVRPFDRSGAVGAGDPAQNSQPKWVYENGLRTLPWLLFEAGRPQVRLGWAVSAIERTPGGWTLRGPKGIAGGFDAVLVTAPSRAASRIMERSTLDTDVRDRVIAAYSAARYRTIVSVAFEPQQPIAPPDGVYALVN